MSVRQVLRAGEGAAAIVRDMAGRTGVLLIEEAVTAGACVRPACEVLTIKYDEVYLNVYRSPAEARQRIGEYIEMHNAYRPHASLEGGTPNMAYEDSGAEAAA